MEGEATSATSSAADIAGSETPLRAAPLAARDSPSKSRTHCSGRAIALPQEVLACLRSAAVFGIDAFAVHVEVDVSFGLPSFTMVGLPDPSVRESRDRVRSAIRNSGFDFPPHRVTVNLAPADVRKAGSAFDLPIALGVLAATGVVERREVDDIVLLGELSLDGGIQATRGVLPIAAAARRDGLASILLPSGNSREAAVVEGLGVIPVDSLNQAVEALNDPAAAVRSIPPAECAPPVTASPDFADVNGQALARRALEIAAAGGHNALMIGPPGAGKTMMARRVPGILPPLSFEEAIESTALHSVCGLLPPGLGLLRERPFRAPHHTISDVALVGGGALPRPGEISLAHNGVLFLDEMPEFDRRALEVLRQPLEEGCVTIARAARTAMFPARFMLIAAMNPCPCGFLGDPTRVCRCSPPEVSRYRGRLSGPLRDRLDLVVEVPAVPAAALGGEVSAEPSPAILERVVAARQRQQARARAAGVRLNAELQGRTVWRQCRPDNPARRLLEKAVERLGLSARGYDRVLKVARTIADLAGVETIRSEMSQRPCSTGSPMTPGKSTGPEENRNTRAQDQCRLPCIRWYSRSPPMNWSSLRLPPVAAPGPRLVSALAGATAIAALFAITATPAFDSFRLKAVTTAATSSAGTVSVEVRVALRPGVRPPLALIARVRNPSDHPLRISITFDQQPVCQREVGGGSRRIDCAFTGAWAAEQPHTIRFTSEGAGAVPWVLQYLEVATHHGATRAYDLIVVPSALTDHRRPGAGWVAGVFLGFACLLTVPSPPLRKSLKLIHAVVFVVVLGFLALVALSPVLSPYLVLLSPRLFLGVCTLAWSPRLWAVASWLRRADDRRLRHRAALLLLVLAGVPAVYGAVVQRLLDERYHGNYSGFIQISRAQFDRNPMLNGRDDVRDTLVLSAGGGYDGQFMYFAAFDPLLRRYRNSPSTYQLFIDAPPYRFARIGFSWLATLFSGGRWQQFPVVMMWLLLASLAGTAVSLACLRPHADPRPLIGALVIVVPSFWQSVQLCLPEPVAASLLVSGFLCVVRGRSRAAGLLLGASLFVRETGALFILALVVSALWRGSRRDAAWLASLGFIPYLAWRLYVGSVLAPEWGLQGYWLNVNNLGMPFVGLAGMLRRVSSGQYYPADPTVSRAAVYYSALLVGGLCTAAFAALRERNAQAVSALLYGILAVSLTFDSIWIHVGNGQRGTYRTLRDSGGRGGYENERLPLADGAALDLLARRRRLCLRRGLRRGVHSRNIHLSGPVSNALASACSNFTACEPRQYTRRQPVQRRNVS